MGAQSSVLMHVCMSVYVFGAWVYSHHVCTWRPEVDIEYLPQLFSTLVFEVDSIVEPGIHWFSRTGWLTSLRSSCLCLPGTSIVYAHYICIQISAWVLSNWPQALLLAHSVFYWLNHFPSLSFFFSNSVIYSNILIHSVHHLESLLPDKFWIILPARNLKGPLLFSLEMVCGVISPELEAERPGFSLCLSVHSGRQSIPHFLVFGFSFLE